MKETCNFIHELRLQITNTRSPFESGECDSRDLIDAILLIPFDDPSMMESIGERSPLPFFLSSSELMIKRRTFDFFPCFYRLQILKSAPIYTKKIPNLSGDLTNISSQKMDKIKYNI